MAPRVKQRKKTHKYGLSVITVGSGVPGGTFSNRTEAMTVIQNHGRYIVLDCGYGSVMRLIKGNFALKDIDVVMFTHLHADHCSDFFNLMLWRYLYGGRHVDLIGPPKTADFYNFFRTFYRDDIVYRAMVFNTGTATGALSGVKVQELKGSQKIWVGGIGIESVPMVHTMYDLAYKFAIGESTVVVPGDTSYNNTLVDFAGKTDMLVLDGSFIIYALTPPETDNFDVEGLLARKIDGMTYEPEPYSGNFRVQSHLNYTDIIKISARIAPKKLLFTHLFGAFAGKPDPHANELKNKVADDLKKSGYMGEVFFAEDGKEYAVRQYAENCDIGP